jgi:hypothetical protein
MSPIAGIAERRPVPAVSRANRQAVAEGADQDHEVARRVEHLIGADEA